MTQQTQVGAAVAVVHVDDELDLATVPALRAEVEQALRARPQTLAVDLSGCAFASVDAVQALVELTRQAREQGTTLLLVGMRRIVRRAISVLGRDSALLFPAPPRPRSGARR